MPLGNFYSLHFRRDLLASHFQLCAIQANQGATAANQNTIKSNQGTVQSSRKKLSI